MSVFYQIAACIMLMTIGILYCFLLMAVDPGKLYRNSEIWKLHKITIVVFNLMFQLPVIALWSLAAVATQTTFIPCLIVGCIVTTVSYILVRLMINESESSESDY